MKTEAQNFGAAFAAHVDANPEAVLIHREGREISRAAVMAEAAALAPVLAADGIGTGDTVAVICADQPRGVEVMLALWSLGAAPVFFDIRQTPEDIRESAARAGAIRLWTDFPRLARETDFHFLPPREGPSATGRLRFDGIDELPAIHLATSGTTGAAKFRTHGHRDFIRLLDRNFSQIGDIHVLNGLALGSLAFNAVAAQWLRALTYGCTLVSLPLFHDIRELDAALALPILQTAALPPVLIRDLLDLHETRDGPAYPHLHRLSTVGGPIAADDLIKAGRLLSPAACNTYSMSHAGAVAMLSGPDAEARPASVGRPVTGVEVWIEDQAGARLPVGAVGRIVVQLRWLEDRVVRPGDLGHLDEDGFLYVDGRVQQLACRRSATIVLSEIDAAVLRIAEVRDAMAFALPDSRDEGDRVALAVESALPRAELARIVKSQLSTLQHPDLLLVTPALPRTASGKIALDRLISMAQEKESGFDPF